MLSAQAAGTQVKLLRFSFDHNSGWLNIRQPASSCMLFGVAYPITEVCCFATDIAFCSQMVNSFSSSCS
jgi:hypothetical protein